MKLGQKVMYRGLLELPLKSGSRVPRRGKTNVSQEGRGRMERVSRNLPASLSKQERGCGYGQAPLCTLEISGSGRRVGLKHLGLGEAAPSQPSISPSSE